MPLTYKAALRKDKNQATDTVMQHRHMAFIASVIGNSQESNYDKRRWADVFAQSLAKSNQNFDRARFFSAVGVDDPYVTKAAYDDPDYDDQGNLRPGVDHGKNQT
jgi:hypothetical protein